MKPHIYKTIAIHPALKQVVVRGEAVEILDSFVINGVAKSFQSRSAAMAFIESLDSFTAVDGVVTEFVE